MIGLSLLIRARKLAKFDPAKAKRRKGMVRVGVYVAVVMLGIGTFSFRSAKADMGKSSLAFGHDLAALSDVMKETTQIRLNGETVFVSNAVTDSQTVDAVLDRFEAHCKNNVGAIGQAWRELSKVGAKETSKMSADPLGFGVIRQEKNGEGIVVCLTKGANTAGTFSEAAREFIATKDLGRLGKLRYAYVRKTASGNTQVLTAWTEDTFNFEKIAPKDGSEPAGADSKDIPRPPESKRVMSAEVANTPFAARIYRSGQEPHAIMSFYDVEMDSRGWLIIDPKEAEGQHRAYMKDGVQIIVSTGKDDTGTIVSIGELAAVDMR